jgi:hypothetical protein
LLTLFLFSQQKKDTLITQTINYTTAKAGEVYMVWTQDYWKTVPEKRYWPEHTQLKGKMLYTKMTPNNGSFSTNIALPAQPTSPT